jgi:poly-beta-1,6-N-acetyl-D-glucosamine synthase
VSAWVSAIASNPVYVGVMVFVGTYPLVTGLYWIAGALVFAVHRERDAPGFYELETFPHVSVLVPAHNEESGIRETVECLLELDWPCFDVTVVDDGSTDRTSEVLVPLADAGRIRLITKRDNEGKAMALNDALPLLVGEIVLIVDADGRPQRDALRWMVPHFVKVPRVAAVTGNPRVANTTTLLAKLQAIEFSATISVLRRAQATWGRLMTFSGICTALRKSAIEQVGRFEIGIATEDIALA